MQNNVDLYFKKFKSQKEALDWGILHYSELVKNLSDEAKKELSYIQDYKCPQGIDLNGYLRGYIKCDDILCQDKVSILDNAFSKMFLPENVLVYRKLDLFALSKFFCDVFFNDCDLANKDWLIKFQKKIKQEKNFHLFSGRKIVDNGFMSTSLLKSFVIDWGNEFPGAVLVIKVSKGTLALYLPALLKTEFDYQHEILFDRGVRLFINNALINNDRILELECEVIRI